MEPLEPWLDRTILRTVASFCSSYNSDLKQIYSLNHIVLEYIPTRKHISTVKEFEKPKKKKATLPVWIMTTLCLDRSVLIFSFYFFQLLKTFFYFFSAPLFHQLFFLWAAFMLLTSSLSIPLVSFASFLWVAFQLLGL